MLLGIYEKLATLRGDDKATHQKLQDIQLILFEDAHAVLPHDRHLKPIQGQEEVDGVGDLNLKEALQGLAISTGVEERLTAAGFPYAVGAHAGVAHLFELNGYPDGTVFADVLADHFAQPPKISVDEIVRKAYERNSVFSLAQVASILIGVDKKDNPLNLQRRTQAYHFPVKTPKGIIVLQAIGHASGKVSPHPENEWDIKAYSLTERQHVYTGGKVVLLN